MFNKRAKEIVNILMATETAITGAKIAEQLHVSNRTIRSDIAQINTQLAQEGIEIKSRNPQGYFFEENDKTLLMMMLDQAKESEYFPTTPTQRIIYLLMMLLMNEEPISMNACAEIMFVSKATINSDFRSIIEYTKQQKTVVQLQSNTNGIRLVGNEVDIRIIATKFINSQENGIDMLMKTLTFISANHEKREEVIVLYQSVVNMIERYAVYMTDKEVHSLVIYVVIAVLRIQKRHEVCDACEDKQVSQLALHIARKSAEIFRIGFTRQEMILLEQRLEGKRIMNQADLNQSDIRITSCINTFLKQVKEVYGFDFSQHANLRQFLYFHIQPMLHRIRHQESEENPLKDDIKKKFPLAIEISFLLQDEIKKTFSLHMNDSEISYIALHVAAALEVEYTPARILLVSSLGSSPLQLMKTKLENHFTNKITIVGCFTNYQFTSMLEKQEVPQCDAILTTSHLHCSLDIPIVKVNPLIVREDISTIKHYIHYYSTEIKDKDKIVNLFDKSLFIRMSKKTTYYEAIKVLTHQLLLQDIIDDEEQYYQLILKREEAYSTIMRNRIAIPHAYDNIAKRTVLVVGVFEQPIEHLNKKISLILLNAINEHEDLQTLYAAIEKMLEIENVDALSQAIDFQGFMDVLL